MRPYLQGLGNTASSALTHPNNSFKPTSLRGRSGRDTLTLSRRLATARCGLTQALGMLRKFHRILKIQHGLLLSLTLIACHVTSNDLINRDQALKLAEDQAKLQGYKIDQYQLDTFGDEHSAGPEKFVFIFLCKPITPPPGCSFLAVVDRRNGTVEIHKGE